MNAVSLFLSQPEGCAVLTALEEVMTMDRNSVAHALVRFFLAHGSVLPLLDVLTLREINSTGEKHTHSYDPCSL